VPFVIGDPAAANAPLVLPPPPADLLALPPLADVAARWLMLLGLALVLGGLVFRALVWRPGAIAAATQMAFDRRARQAEVTGAVIAAGGTLAALLVASVTAGANPLVFATGSRVGLVLLARLMAIAALAMILWRARSRRLTLGLGAALIALVTLSILSHSAAPRGTGTWAAAATLISIGFDLLHLVATAAWIGGLPALLLAIIAVRRHESERRGAILTPLVARFTGVATAAVIVLAATGTFAAMQQIGGPGELWTTAYGRALLIKLALFGGLLLFGGLNRWWLHPRLAGDGGESGLRAMRRSVGAEIGLSLLLLVAVGVLTASAPAREAAAQGPGTTQTARVGGVQLSLQVVPGDVAGDTYAVTARGLPAGAEPEAVLRASMPAHHMDPQELRLREVEPSRWGARGALLAMPGLWDVEAIVRAPGMNDVRHMFYVDTSPATGAGESQPAAPWTVLLTAALVLAALSQLAIDRRWQGRLQTGALATIAVAFVATAIPYYGARASEVRNPLGETPEVLAAGEAIYRQSCASCHGASGRGDGPAADMLAGLPAAFTVPHFGTHSDAEVFEWIRDGKPGTAMPAFGDQLSEEAIWQVITHIRRLYSDSQSQAARQ
jgi:copper transport protein